MIGQDLTVTVVSNKTGEELRLIPDEDQRSSLNESQEFTDAQEWRLYDHISIKVFNPFKGKAKVKSVDDPDAEREQLMAKIGLNLSNKFRFPRPQLSVSCKALRRWKYYVLNIVIILVSLFFKNCHHKFIFIFYRGCVTTITN